MGYTNKGGKLQLTFIESAKKKNTCKHIIKGFSVSTCCLLLPCRACRGAPLRHPAPLCTPSSCAGPAYARPPPPGPIDCRGREHLPAPTPKEPMQGVRGRETGALAPPVRSLASTVADPSNRRRASAARLFVTSKQTPMCVRLCPGENRRD